MKIKYTVHETLATTYIIDLDKLVEEGCTGNMFDNYDLYEEEPERLIHADILDPKFMHFLKAFLAVDHQELKFGYGTMLGTTKAPKLKRTINSWVEPK